ncbi:MAG: hypothetical protein Ct9H300mP16_03940 [Pseudomonadota bacterium]|nr:MAG: hypothetical protein Ct9H300mP16_03940 [Pseudomonadota bacterium]
MLNESRLHTLSRQGYVFGSSALASRRLTWVKKFQITGDNYQPATSLPGGELKKEKDHHREHHG